MWWQGFLLSLSLCLDLGVVNVAAMRAGVQAGTLASLALGIGSCFGDLVYAGVALTGVVRLVGIPAVRWLLWIAGSAVLAYLAIDAFRGARRALPPSDAGAPDGARRHSARYFWQGFVLALASPTAILWFASVGGAVIATTAGHSTAGVWPFFAGFFGGGVLWSAFVAVVSGLGGRFGASFVRGFSFVSAVVFAALAVQVFVSGYRTFVSP